MPQIRSPAEEAVGVVPFLRHVEVEAFSPDRSTVAVGLSRGGTKNIPRVSHRLWLFDAKTGRQRVSLDHPERVLSALFTPDGRFVVTRALFDDTARVWDAATGALRFSLKHKDRVTAIGLAFGGTVVVTASRDNTVRLWSLSIGAELATLPHDDGVESLSISPDGTMLATGSFDKTARVWELVPAGK